MSPHVLRNSPSARIPKEGHFFDPTVFPEDVASVLVREKRKVFTTNILIKIHSHELFAGFIGLDDPEKAVFFDDFVVPRLCPVTDQVTAEVVDINIGIKGIEPSLDRFVDFAMMEDQGAAGLENGPKGREVVRVVGEEEFFDRGVGDVDVVRVNDTVPPCQIMNHHAILIR